MCISSEFCEANLQLLLTTIERSRDEVIRSNSVIALGDIAMCYNNLVDQNIASLYKRLQDSHLSVKRNTLMVLTHLILNGMIKVKGQIGELAKCVEDPDKQIRDLSRMFFSELATKDNVIYNLIPDMVSTLCTDPSVSNLYEILKFIFGFLKKDRQTENIAEKLCQRFKATDSIKQWQDISFCLSLVPFNTEKAIVRLLDNFLLFEKVLNDPVSSRNFQEILTKVGFY
jgi:condensin complex subunit 1